MYILCYCEVRLVYFVKIRKFHVLTCNDYKDISLSRQIVPKNRKFTMKTDWLKSLPSFKAPLKINSITKAIAISGLAIGAAAMIPAAPAGAVLLNSGSLGFGDGTTDFFTSVDQTSYAVTFSPSQLALITNVTGAFSSTFAQNELRAITPTTGTFNLVAGSANVFSLASALNFNFLSNGVNVSIGAGSTFTRNFNNVNAGVEFSGLNATGSVTNADGTVNLPSLAFTFNDIPSAGGGIYGITLSPNNPTAVPEPFTVIGTIVGGAAALRMRKKLAKAAKN